MSANISIFTLFLSISLCRGNTGSIPDGLLERIEAIEQRENVHISRIEFLENRVNDYNRELENLQEANGMLRQDLKDTTTKLQDKTKVIEEVKKDMEDMQQKSYVQAKSFRDLEAEVTRLRQIADSTRDGHNEGEQTPNHEREEDNGENTEDLYQTIRRVNLTDGARTNFASTLKMGHKLSGDGRKRNLLRQDKQLTESVAFHAVATPLRLDHLGTHETIIFDHALLNLGNSYHDQHGLFTAPRSGLYMFSVSIATDPNVTFWATLVRNGQTLASIIGPAVTDHTQGSVTVLTQLNQGDDVWVIHTHPDDRTIWGNYFTSFCGILLIEA